MDKRPCVLVIDDQDAVLARTATALRGVGINVVTTTQTVGIAHHLRSCDLVLVDYHMPGRDGASVAQSLLEAAGAMDDRPSILLYTSDPQACRDWQRRGFDGLLSNKGDDEHLVVQVQAALRTRRLRAASRKTKTAT